MDADNVEGQLMDMDTGGTFQGHMVGGFVFVLFGVFYLSLAMKRVRSMRPGHSYVEAHVPEKDLNLMKRVASVVMLLLTLGILGEGLPGCYGDWPGATGHLGLCFFHQLFHETMYAMYQAVCIVAILEAQGLLPPDSWRAMLALVSFFAFLMWEEHSHMKRNLSDGHTHHFLGVVSLLQAATLAYSVLHPKNLIMYIAGFGLCILNGVWFATAGLSFIAPIPTHDVATVFVLEALFVTLSITFGAAVFAKPTSGEAHHECDNLVGISCETDDDDEDEDDTEGSDDSV